MLSFVFGVDLIATVAENLSHGERRAPRARATARGPRARRADADVLAAAGLPAHGVIGAVFAMISALFCVMVVVVGSAAAGREVDDELDRIRRGERPAED
jgi:hypothetical protein